MSETGVDVRKVHTQGCSGVAVGLATLVVGALGFVVLGVGVFTEVLYAGPSFATNSPALDPEVLLVRLRAAGATAELT